MKHTKKILAVLLSVLMLFSLASAAFAETNWTPLPKSAEGLSKGDLYLDFSGMTPGGYADAYNEADWYIDLSTCNIKAVHPYAGENGEDVGTEYLTFLREVGVEWTPVPFSTEGLNEGDYYIDLMAYYKEEAPEEFADLSDAELAEMQEELSAFADMFEVYIYPDSNLFRYKIVANMPMENEETGEMVIVPMERVLPLETYYPEELAIFGLDDTFDYLIDAIRQYHVTEDPSSDPSTEPSTEPATGEEPVEQQKGFFGNLIEKISNFFKKLVEWFRNFFASWKKVPVAVNDAEE